MATLVRNETPAQLQSISDLISHMHGEPWFKAYCQIPKQIIKCLQHFRVDFDHEKVHELMSAYYSFIGAADHVLDYGGIELGKCILAEFDDDAINERPSSNRDCFDSKMSLVKQASAILRRLVPVEQRPILHEELSRLFDLTLRERNARDVYELVAQRKEMGRRTAALGFRLIEPQLRSGPRNLARFFERVGTAGCLVDSWLDWRDDQANGLLSLKMRSLDLAYLTMAMMSHSLPIALAHPRLVPLFVQAIRAQV
jgi:hypothetical protein